MSVLKRKILSVVGNHILSEGKIAEVSEVAENFRLIDIEAECLKREALRIGDKVQIHTGAWNLRTYTPLWVDPEMGRLGILAYIHGRGPGSRWATSVREGDPCQFLGPKRSLRLPPLKGPLVFFGDETAIAAATTFKRRLAGDHPMKFIFESASPSALSTIARDVGLGDAEVHSKKEDAMLATSRAATEASHLVLVGRAQSIQAMRARLRSTGFPASRVIAKAYWSERCGGLD